MIVLNISEGWQLDLGRLVASTCRQKIMTALASVGQTHMMDLVRKVNSTYTQVDRNLKILQKEGIVEIKYFGRMRMIKLNRENPKTEVILKALRMLTRARIS